MGKKRIYELRINGKRVLAVDCEVPEWLKITPKVSKVWLRKVVASKLAEGNGASPVETTVNGSGSIKNPSLQETGSALKKKEKASRKAAVPSTKNFTSGSTK